MLDIIFVKWVVDVNNNGEIFVCNVCRLFVIIEIIFCNIYNIERVMWLVKVVYKSEIKK